MPATKPKRLKTVRKKRLADAIKALTALQFGPRQRNEVAAYTLLALLDLKADAEWVAADAPLRGITPVIEFIANAYGVRYAPNTRETIRDEAVKYFAEEGLLLRNPDDPNRPTNSGRTVYQVEPTALHLLRKFGTDAWAFALKQYLASRETIKSEITRKRTLARVPVTLPDGEQVALSPGGQNPLIKAIIEEFCPIFVPGGAVIYIGDTENKFVHLETEELTALGVTLDSAAKSRMSSSTTPPRIGCFSSKLSPVPDQSMASDVRNSRTFSLAAKRAWSSLRHSRIVPQCAISYRRLPGNPKSG